MFYVYKFLDKEGNALYVGQSIDIDRRISEHSGKPWDKEKDHIEFAECKSCTDMCIYEIYYINKLKATYNKELVYDMPSITLPELEWQVYNRDWKKIKEEERISEIRRQTNQKFSPENYWNNKIESLTEKIERLSNENDEYKNSNEYIQLTKKLNDAKNKLENIK